jgi:hypothetical protein
MGFLAGSTTFSRYRVTNDTTGEFGEDHLKILTDHRIGAHKTDLSEESAIGFTGGAHLLDTNFDLEKNLIGEALHFGIRTDSVAVPGPIKNAWMKIELAGIMHENVGGRPSKAQREEAKEAVDARCTAEAKKGNYLRMSETTVLWDAATETLFLSSNSEKSNDACLDLINRAFGLEFSRVTSGKLALEYADEAGLNADMFATEPTSFFSDQESSEIVWWNGMSDNYDYLGNEFLLWLWWKWDTGNDTIALSDKSEVTGMFARSLSLDCPLAEHGKESISSESPVALPEAAIAIRRGKLPRKAGLMLIRNDEQYDFNLQAETFGVGAGRISHPGTGSTEPRDLLDRVESIRQLADTLDFLFEAFCIQRIGKKWSAESKLISRWLENETALKRRAAA